MDEFQCLRSNIQSKKKSGGGWRGENKQGGVDADKGQEGFVREGQCIFRREMVDLLDKGR